MIEVRIYRIEDQEAVVALWWDSWHSIRPGLRHPQTLSDWRRRWVDEIVPAQVIVVAEDEGAVVGFAAADVTVSELTQIFVAPSLKRRGIGQALLAWAQRSMPEGFSLHTLVENVASRTFYDRHGLVAGDRRISEVNGMETIEYRWGPSERRQENRVTTIDQQTRRRMARTGLTALDEARACPGYTLYAPMFGSGTVYLLDLHGREVHRWELPYPPGLYGYLLPNGNLFYGGKIRDETWDRFPAWHRFKGGVLLEVDWRGNVVWEYRDPNHHHDARRTPSGGALYLTVERIPDTVAARVQGGVPGSERQGMWADVLVEIDASGHRLWEWHAYEHLDVATDIITFNDARDEWSHANTVVPLPGERVLVSFRNISTVAIIDQRTGAFVWKLGYEVLAQQHDPSPLANGNILVFDNGAHRKDQAMPASRVLEVEPTTKTIVWEYHDSPLYNFFSPYISGARRLPNGNTLITEGNLGRMFQVTPDKQVVWEYVNPYFPAGPDGAPVNAVFRATHYLPEDIPALR